MIYIIQIKVSSYKQYFVMIFTSVNGLNHTIMYYLNVKNTYFLKIIHTIPIIIFNIIQYLIFLLD